jgi:type IV secretory pathway VirB10-like protein
MTGLPEQPVANAAQALRLRAPPAQVTRLSKRALTASAAVLALALAGALSWSLVERKKPAPERVSTPAPAPPERVTSLPKGYSGAAGVPTLGPPMPGDLGRPFLAAQRQGRPTGWPNGAVEAPSTVPSAPSAVGASPPIQQNPDPRVEARHAALKSGLFVMLPVRPEAVAVGQIGGQGVAKVDPRTTSLERLQDPASPYILQAGAVIAAALITGLRSDTPGLATAQVTQDVHDSLGGGVLLIPAGSRLIGAYDAQIRSGQSRLAVAWTRLILPSGRSIVLDDQVAADAQGMAGLRGGVDRHGGRVLAAAALSTVLAIGAESGSSNDESSLVRAIRRGGAEAVSDTGRQVVGRGLDLAPTLTIRPGAPLRVLLNKDLVLEPYLHGAGQ